jgi:hypothetical protein
VRSTKGNEMNGYLAFFKEKKLEIYAPSLYAAKLKAVAEFKPSKKDSGLVSICLAEVSGKQITHKAEF